MHRMLRRTALMSVAASLSMTASAWAETVTLMGYSGIFEDYYKRAVVEPFMEAHPDITVEYYGMVTSAQMLGTLRAQSDAPQIDAAIMDVSVAKAAADENLFAPMNAEVVPNYDNLYLLAQPEGVNAAGVTFDNLVLVYSAERLSHTPTSWEEFWDPAHKGRMSVSAAPNIQGVVFTFLANKMAGGTDYLSDVMPGIEKLKELAPLVQTWDPKPDTYQAIESGQLDLGTGWNARAQTYAAASEGRLGVVLPEEGSGFQINVIALVENAPSSDAAKVFVEYALGPEAQAAFTEAMFYAPTNRDAVQLISEEALAKTAASRMDDMIDIDWIAAAGIREEITEQWRRNIIPLSR